MAGEIKVILEKGAQTEQTMFDSQPTTTSTATATEQSPLMGGLKIAGVMVVARAAYKLAQQVYERQRDIEMDNRVTTEKLRNYGGAGFSPNTIGDRLNIFGRRISGDSIAYRRR